MDGQDRAQISATPSTAEYSSAGAIRFNRRHFSNCLLIGSAGLVLVPRLSTQLPPQYESLVQYPPMKIEGAEKLVPGASLYFEYPTGRDPAVLIRSSEGEFAAYSRRCTHAGCAVEFDVGRRCLKCPCHKGAYDTRAGNVLFGPPLRPLEQIVLQLRSGSQIWAVGKIIGRATENIA
jgi:Rieske Fe-S protein